jgi:DNA modification methylase
MAVAGAKLRGMKEVPVIRLPHLSPEQRKALVIADNQLALNAGWDTDRLAVELKSLIEIDYDVTVLGFEQATIDILNGDAAAKANDNGPEEDIPLLQPSEVSRPEDLWVLGEHRLLCGDCLDERAYSLLLGEDQADLVFTDPPYNVAVNGHVSGLGRAKHAEFAMASGEMSEAEFIQFLADFLKLTRASVRDGAILFVCMDWAHLFELQSAARQVGLTQKNLCVWSKVNGGMGSLYRSKHELVGVYKAGSAPHVNNVELGKHGRYRTNVWEYAGANSFRAGRMDDLAAHPTVKPVALVADAILDCSRRRDIVLDPFSGSGTTILAAEKTGRRARAIEIAPSYVDVGVRRWQAFTGRVAVLAATGQSFEEVQAERASAEPTEEAA